MKNKTKMFVCLSISILFGVLSQIFIGNSGTWITTGIFLFGIGFGWYGSKTKEDELNKRRKK